MYGLLMIIGIGVDLVVLTRFAGYINRSQYMRDRLFSKSELTLSVNQLAGNFAVKEALLKASLKKFEFAKCAVLRNESGKPYIDFESGVKHFNDENILISITNTDEYALAIVLIQTNL